MIIKSLPYMMPQAHVPTLLCLTSMGQLLMGQGKVSSLNPLSPLSNPDLFLLVYNKFGPLLQNSKTSSSSSVTLGLSSKSGPFFLPGLEKNIPTQTKLAQMRKRKKKLEKKKLKLIGAMDQSRDSDDQPMHTLGTNKVDDIIEMADIMGLTFN